MRRALLNVARNVGAPGLLTWTWFIGIYLWIRVPRGDWYWADLAKYTAMVLVVSYFFGAMRRDGSEVPYILCMSCGKKNAYTDADDVYAWSCGYCQEKALVRVGPRKELSE